MPDALLAGLIVGPATAIVTWLLFGRRRSADEHEASVAAQWKAWSREQGSRIDDLTSRVENLEGQLAESERKNRKYAVMHSALVRWSLALRDALIAAGGAVPPAPPEVEEALTTLEM